MGLNYLTNLNRRPSLALQFGANVSDGVTIPNNSTIENFTEFSFLCTVYPTLFTTGGRRLMQKGLNIGVNLKRINWTATAQLDCNVRRATTNAVSTTNASSWVVNTWYT